MRGRAFDVVLTDPTTPASHDLAFILELLAVRSDLKAVAAARAAAPAEFERSALSNPDADPIAHLERRAEQGLRPGGFGILVTRQIVHEMYYNERGNEAILIKRLE